MAVEKYQASNEINSLFSRVEPQGDRIDAVALTGRWRPVGKEVTQMTATAGAVNLGTPHEEAAVFSGSEVFRSAGDEKTRPAAPGIELGLRVEKLRPATRAVVAPCTVLIMERAAEGTLRPLLARNTVFFRREDFAPLGVCTIYLFHRITLHRQSAGELLSRLHASTVNRDGGKRGA